MISLFRYPAATCLAASIVLCTALASPVPYAAQALAQTMTSRKQLVSAYTYNFLLFAHWPQEEQETQPDAVTICIVGDEPFAELFGPVTGQKIKDTKYTLKIKTLHAPVQSSDLENCILLFVGGEAHDFLPDILAQVKGLPILTVSDQPDFVLEGGMIGLVERNGKLRWQINQRATQDSGLRLDAQLLRNAESVIDDGTGGQ